LHSENIGHCSNEDESTVENNILDDQSGTKSKEVVDDTSINHDKSAKNLEVQPDRQNVSQEAQFVKDETIPSSNKEAHQENTSEVWPIINVLVQHNLLQSLKRLTYY